MANNIDMPKLGLTMTAGTITNWLKAEGDRVAVGEEICEIETEKLTSAVESPLEGVLLKILVKNGEEAPCMTPIAVVGEAGEKVEQTQTATEASVPAEEPPAAVKSAPDQTVDLQTGRVNATPAAKRLAQLKGVDIRAAAASGLSGCIRAQDVIALLATSCDSDVKASPLAKKLAAEGGVELKEVPAAGSRIMSADVRGFMARAAQIGDAREERAAMSGMRRTIGRRMRESADISPTVTYNLRVDMSSMKEMKQAFAAAGEKVSYTDLLVMFTSRALLEFPLVNCSIEGGDIIFKRYVNMGIAVAVEGGLVVPVLRDAHLKGLAEISREIKRLAGAAREGKLSPDDMSGGTFTITNLGMYGVEFFNPIINQPETAIMGVNAITDTPVAVNGEVAIRPLMTLSLTADHRAIDGAIAAQFLARLKSLMENPALILI